MSTWLEQVKRHLRRHFGTKSMRRMAKAKPASRRFGVESLEDRTVPAITLSGLNALTGEVTFTGDGGANALILSRWETMPGSGVYYLRHNVSGGGLNSFIDLDPGSSGDQTLTLGLGTARDISVNLLGGNDTLAIDNSWTFNHQITYDGGADGGDKLVGNNAANTWQVTDLATFAGSLSTGAENVLFVGVKNLVGGVGDNPDTLNGENAARTWNLGTSQTYGDGTNAIAFSEMEVLQGGSAADSFHVQADTTLSSLQGGDGADLFAFHLTGGAPVTLTAAIDGQAGSDVLSFVNYNETGAVVATLIGLGSTDGFWGMEVSISGSFTNIDTLTGAGTADDSLKGRDAEASWMLDSSPRYVSGNAIDFSAIEQLAGGSDVDTFTVTADHVGNLGGDDGADIFYFDGATVTGDVAGDTGGDTFHFAGGSIVGVLTGNAGNDQVNVTASASISGGISGGENDYGVSVSGSSVVLTTNVSGDAGNDSVTMAGTTSVVGAIAGHAGTDTLSFAGHGSARAIALMAIGSTDGFNGIEASITGGFSDVNVLVGSGHADTLSGRDATASWEVDGTNRYLNGETDLAFSAVENLVGGSAVDTFTVTANHAGDLTGNAEADLFSISAALTGSLVANGGNDEITLTGFGSISGNIAGGVDNDVLILAGFSAVGGLFDGGEGSDTLSFSGYANARSVILTAPSDEDGFAGTEASLVGGFTHVNVVIGSANTDTLTGDDANADWSIDGGLTELYSATNTVEFSAFESLVGGSAIDVFEVTANFSGDLNGSAGNDEFNLAGSALVSGNVTGGDDDDALVLSGSSNVGGNYAGGAGNDTLSYAGRATAATVVLTGVGSDSGFNGSGSGVGGTFTDVNVLVGSGEADSLTGLDAAATWEVDGTNRYVSEGKELAFTALENLVGGSAEDNFDVTANHAGDLIGNAGADDFNFRLAAILTGNVTGNGGADTFDLSDTARVVGALEGGTGNDSLRYAGYASAVSVVLGGPATTDGYNGVVSAVTGGFSAIDVVAGSGHADTLTGEQTDSTWIIDSSLTYNDGQVANNLTFSSFESLVGSAADDTFRVMNDTAFTGSVTGGVGVNVIDYSDVSNVTGVGLSLTGINAGNVAGAFTFSAVNRFVGGAGNDTVAFTTNGARMTGTINGGGGADWLDYTGTSTAVRVSLAAGSASGTAGASNFENVIGGSGNDLLIGNASSNVLDGAGGNDVLNGGDGNDVFNGGAGNDLMIGGLGADTMDGGTESDVLIGGVTTYDANVTALNALMAEWGRSSIPFDTRVGRLSGTATGGLNGSYRLTDSQVNDDAGAIDVLTGSAGLDWFFSSSDNLADLNAGTEALANVT